jgi:hypothetical protein
MDAWMDIEIDREMDKKVLIMEDDNYFIITTPGGSFHSLPRGLCG